MPKPQNNWEEEFREKFWSDDLSQGYDTGFVGYDVDIVQGGIVTGEKTSEMLDFITTLLQSEKAELVRGLREELRQAIQITEVVEEIPYEEVKKCKFDIIKRTRGDMPFRLTAELTVNGAFKETLTPTKLGTEIKAEIRTVDVDKTFKAFDNYLENNGGDTPELECPCFAHNCQCSEYDYYGGPQPMTQKKTTEENHSKPSTPT